MTAFVGRERELEALLAGLEDTLAGQGRLFLVSGEPGIGKSRLADELANRARGRGADVLVGRCWEAGGAPPFWPWVQAIRARLRDRDPEAVRSELGVGASDVGQIVPELHLLFPDLLEPPSLESEAARFRLFDGVASFLRNTAQDQPIVLVLDDLHAADEPSLLLLQFVARDLGTSRLLIVGGYRDVDPTLAEPLATALAELAREPATRTLSLSGLGVADVARFIELATAHEPREGFVETVHAETEGNPLFVGEIVRLLAAEGGLDAPRPQLAIPQSVKEVIGRRLRHLSAECTRTLTFASVLGREFDVDALALVSGLDRDSLRGLLGEAAVEQVIAEMPGSPGRLRFTHALIREVLYDELPAPRRRELHQTVGEALEDLYATDLELHLAEIALHFFEAHDARAVDYARRAGDHAAALLAYEEAARLHKMALALGDDHERPRLLLQAARSMWMAGATRAERAVEARDALLAGGDRGGTAEAEMLLANIYWYEGHRDLVSEHMESAVQLVRDEPVSRTKAQVLAQASRFHMLADEDAEAIKIGREGLAMAEQLGLEGLLADCLINIGTARVSLGDLGGMQDLEKAIAVAVAARDGWEEQRARTNLAECLLWQVGDADSAFAQWHEVSHLLQRAGYGPLTRFNHVYEAQECYWRGRWEEAIRACGAFIAQVEAGSPHVAAPEMYSMRGLIALAQGAAGALDDARKAVTLGRRAQDPQSLYPAIASNAQVAVELGRPEEADRLLDELFAYRTPQPDPGHLVPMSLAALIRGREKEALARLARLEHRSPWHDAAVAMLRGDHVEAAEVFATIGVLPEEAHSRLLAAEALVAAGRQVEAGVQLERCLPFFESVDATRYLSRGRRLLSRVPAISAAFAGYRIESEIGRGGMGVVYLATELALDRPVALKLIAPELAHDRSFHERFLRESRLAASLDHPGILPVYAAGDAGGDLYLATRYVDGTDLRAILAEERTLPAERALALVGQVAEALDAAHRRGLVHRDVKPGNVLVDASDHCYLCDFGLTKQLGDGGTTASGLLAGSLDYLAPEQIRREEVNGRTDEYALACVLYECLSGAPPFRRDTEAQTLWAHMQEEPPQLAAYPELPAVFARGLAKESARRYETCAAFVDDARSELGLGPSPTAVRRRRLRVGRRLVLAGAALIAAAAAAVAFALTLGAEGAIVAPPNSLAAIDPVSRTVVAAIPVGAAPTTVAASDDWVWVINSGDGAGTISRIDPNAHRVVKTFSVFGTPNDLLAAAGALWVGTTEGRVFRIDPSSDLEDQSWPLPNAEKSSPFVFDAGAGYLAYGANTVWAASFRAISRIDPTTSELVPGTSAVWGRLAYGFGSIWTIGLERRLVRLAPVTLRPRATLELSFGLVDVAVGEGSVWLPDERGHQVWQVDPARNVVEDTYDVGGRTGAVAVGAGAVWAPSDDGALVRIDPTTDETERIEVGGAPTGVAVGAGLVWVSVG